MATVAGTPSKLTAPTFAQASGSTSSGSSGSGCPQQLPVIEALGSMRMRATELVISGWTGRVDFGRAHGPVLYGQPYGSPGVFNRADFSEMIANYNYYQGGRFARIFRDGNGIKLQFGQIEGRGCAQTETYCPGDGFECSTSCVDEYTEFVEKANWYFNDCN